MEHSGPALVEEGRNSGRRFRHVLCVYPYRREREHPGGYWPPLGIEMIAAVLGPHSRKIDVVDLRHETRGAADFLRSETDLVCFSVNWDREGEFVREEIRSVPRRILTILGGRHATEEPRKWLTDCPNVDILVRGDGEEIVDEVASGRRLEDVAGISYRLDGRLVDNPVRRLGPVRDGLYPDRSLRRYVYSLTPHDFQTGLTVDSVASSRGCPFNCKFCSYSRNPWGAKRNWTARPPESVVRELEEIDAKMVLFTDDNFTHDMDRVEAICDLILERGIRKRYAVSARVEIAKRPDVLKKMERAGFSYLLLGIESAQDKTLRSMRKGFDTRQLREYFRVLRRSTMFLHGSFIVGNIGETEKEMCAMAPFARQLGVDTMVLCPLKNARYAGLEELVASTPGYHIAGDGKIYSDEYPPARLRQIRHAIARDFYTPRKVLQILRKARRNEFLTAGMLARLPWFVVRKALEHRRRRKAHLKHERSSARAR